MRVSGFENIPGAPGNLLAGINMSGFDINKRPGALGGRAGEQLKGIYEGGTQQNQQLNEELKNRGIMPRGVNLPLVQGGSSPLGNAGFFEGQNINTFQTPFSSIFLAENQGPSTPIKYYPDANKGQGGYLPNRGAGYPANVRPKGQQFLAQLPPNATGLGGEIGGPAPNVFSMRPRIGYDEQGLDVGGSMNVPIGTDGRVQLTGGYRPDSNELNLRGTIGQPPGSQGLGIDFYVNKLLNKKPEGRDLGVEARYNTRF